MIRRLNATLTSIILAGICAFMLAIPAYAQTSQDVIAKAERWFEKITTMRAQFIQISSDGSSATGTLYLRRPKQMRLQYDGDGKLALVVSGGWLHVDEGAEKQVNSFPIGSTPFAPMLREDIQLRSPKFQTITSQENGVAVVKIIQETGEAAGSLTLEFSETPFALRRWIIEDAVGVTTKVTLQNPVFGEDFNNFLFAVPSYN